MDWDQGIVSREIFVNREIYDQEQEQIFARSWLFVGHESQVAKPGDFFLSSMGEESAQSSSLATGSIDSMCS